MNRDPEMLRMTIIIMGSIVLVCTVGTVVLALLGREPPQLLGYLATTALGGLGSILVNVPKTPNGNGHKPEAGDQRIRV